jgi:hypothetical protein
VTDFRSTLELQDVLAQPAVTEWLIEDFEAGLLRPPTTLELLCHGSKTIAKRERSNANGLVTNSGVAVATPEQVAKQQARSKRLTDHVLKTVSATAAVAAIAMSALR